MSTKQTKQTEAEDRLHEPKVGAIATLLRYRELILSLTYRDIRSRYKQSVLGVAWALMQPLAMTAVYTIVFSRLGRFDTGGVPDAVFYYIAVLPWTFFAQGITTGAECLVGNHSLITKIYFPREIFPIVAVLGKAVDFAIGILVLIPLFCIYRIDVTPLVFIVIPVLIIQTCFLVGLVFLLSCLNLFYRDVRHVMPLLTQIWMYLTPIIYGLSMVPEKYLGIYMLNPMASIMDTYRRVALQGQEPMWNYLGLAAGVAVITLMVGYKVFKKLEPAFAETV